MKKSPIDSATPHFEIMNRDGMEGILWEVREVGAGWEDTVPIAVAALSSHMDAGQRQAFADKLRRYAVKPDRALFLGQQRKGVAGFSSIIDRAPPPRDLPPGWRRRLEDLACGTGLLVRPDFRGYGLGRDLVKAWEGWASARGCAGIWAVTRRMAPWYRRHFGYVEIGPIRTGGVLKSVVVKLF